MSARPAACPDTVRTPSVCFNAVTTEDPASVTCADSDGRLGPCFGKPLAPWFNSAAAVGASHTGQTGPQNSAGFSRMKQRVFIGARA